MHFRCAQPWQEHFESLPGGVPGRSGGDAFREYAKNVPLSVAQHAEQHKGTVFEMPLPWTKVLAEGEVDPKGRAR
jgi:hypothetical protein